MCRDLSTGPDLLGQSLPKSKMPQDLLAHCCLGSTALVASPQSSLARAASCMQMSKPIRRGCDYHRWCRTRVLHIPRPREGWAKQSECAAGVWGGVRTVCRLS